MQGRTVLGSRAAIASVLLLLFCWPASAQETRQATGVKVGEVTDSSAVVWMRLTQNEVRDPADGSCPGAEGRVRLRYGLEADFSDAAVTGWADVSAATDYTRQFGLAGLEARSRYHFSAETAGPGGVPVHGALVGSFTTAPQPDQYAPVVFTVITGQEYEDLDDPAGYRIYDAMLALGPSFIVPTGDTVYYDKGPVYANTPALARWKWHRMYSLPRLLGFHLQVPGLWEKDDHDTLKDDCWPGQTYGTLTFEEGLGIYREQVPMGTLTYRTFRWGKALQVWLVEGRDYRSANSDPDGPQKTIWGEMQKQWLKDTVLASTADWRVLVSPTPVVGPDRTNKSDNHSNAAFGTEGDEIRSWIDANVPDDFFICCGDRHWQYHSVYPGLEVHEFSCGPASDQHAGGSPGEDPEYHRFHRAGGGFLSVRCGVAAGESTITFDLRDVDGAVVYTYSRRKPAGAGPSVRIAAADAVASEAGSDTAAFEISRSVVTDQPLTVRFTVGGTAAAGDDYVALAEAVVIPGGSRAATVVVTPRDDSLEEGEETVVLELVDTADYYVPGEGRAEVCIADDEVPDVTIFALDAVAGEPSDTAEFVLIRSAASGEALDVAIEPGGTAVAGVDYVDIGPSVRIPAHESHTTVSVSPLNDALCEGSETVVLQLAAGAKYNVGSPGSATASITDDDGALLLHYRFDEASGTTAADSSPTPYDGTVHGEAAPAWTAGRIEGALGLDGTDDFVDAGDPADGALDFEAAEDFTVSAWIRATDLPADQYGIVGKGDGGGNARLLFKILGDGRVLVTLRDAADAGVEVTGSTNLVDGQWHHAAASCDRDSGVRLFADGRLDASLAQPSEVDLSTAGSLYFGKSEKDGGRRFFKGSIDDLRIHGWALGEAEVAGLSGATSLPTVTIAATDAAASERGPEAGVFTVTRVGPTGSDLTISYAVAGSATAGVDYEELPGAVTIQAQAGSATITLTPVADDETEGAEAALVRVLPDTGYLVGSPGAAVIGIQDDEPLATAGGGGGCAPGGRPVPEGPLLVSLLILAALPRPAAHLR